MTETRYILAGRLIDGSGAGVRRRVLLEVKDGRITAISPAADLPSKAAVDDLSHCTIVPAMVDCSVSLLRSPSVDCRFSPKENNPEMLERHIRYCHAHGVLGVAVHDDNALLRPDLAKAAQKSLIDIRSSSDAAEADFLRIVYSGNIDDAEGASVQLDREELCRRLRNRGKKKAIVLANGSQQVAEALEAGCDAIEQGYGMGEDNIKKMAEKEVLWIPSLLRAKNALDSSCGGGSVCCRFSTRYVAPGQPVPGAEAFWKKTLAEQLAQLSLARQHGVQVAVGTGAGSVGILHGESVVEEMKLFIKAEYSLEEAIRCASDNGAKFFGMEQLGWLAVGQRATFLVTRGTAQQLPRKLAYLEGIYVDGVHSSAYTQHS